MPPEMNRTAPSDSLPGRASGPRTVALDPVPAPICRPLTGARVTRSKAGPPQRITRQDHRMPPCSASPDPQIHVAIHMSFVSVPLSMSSMVPPNESRTPTNAAISPPQAAVEL